MPQAPPRPGPVPQRHQGRGPGARPGMRARAIQAARAARVAVEVVDGRAEDLSFPDAAFDTVVASLVLCTVPDPAGALAEARSPGCELGALPWLLGGREGGAAPRPGCAVGLNRLDAWETARRRERGGTEIVPDLINPQTDAVPLVGCRR